ncbi:hypothetical protein AB1Y20_021760 [Prymnesium parvum]|uniref:U2A'/phosphoprotein 32 family A C-terminal domain-containing protein n=1 Tax=Prymnesium parvum TaxID=97485 RepID=A0AB34JM51_PRYPA
MRLTADVIARSPAFINALKDRELDLRGNKIAVLENLAATQNQFDSIDLSDNEITKLECMAILPRLRMLLMHNNRVNRFSDNLGRSFPNLETLALSNNQLVTLKELEPLAALKTLTSLSLMDNLVTKQKGYRSFVIALLPNLRLLDYKKVKQAERKEAQTAAKRQRLAAPAQAEVAGFVPSAEQIAMIKEAIANASSLEEVSKLEKALKSGNYDAIIAATGGGTAGASAAPAAATGAAPASSDVTMEEAPQQSEE